jgi:hypothetical protein
MTAYEEARSLISDGDAIMVKSRRGLLAHLTRFFTRSDYTHGGVAFWTAGGLWMTEINSGKNHAIPLSQLSETDFDVYCCPIADAKAMRYAIQEAMRVKIHYGWPSLFVIGLINYFRIKVFLHARKILSCAGYCVMTYELAGWPEHSRILSPADLAGLLKFKLSVSNRAA